MVEIERQNREGKRAFNGLTHIKQAVRQINKGLGGPRIVISTVSQEPTSYAAGQFPINRGGFERALIRLFDAYAPKRDKSWREYGVDIENDTFWIHVYRQSAECTCEVESRRKEWLKSNTHTADCINPRLARLVKEIQVTHPIPAFSFLRPVSDAALSRWASMLVPSVPGPTEAEMLSEQRADRAYKREHRRWTAACRVQDKAIADLVIAEAVKVGITLTAQDAYWRWEYLCTCGWQTRKDQMERDEADRHTRPCETWWSSQPQFYHKSSGYGLYWYKYPCRAAYGTQEMPLRRFQRLVRECIRSIRPP